MTASKIGVVKVSDDIEIRLVAVSSLIPSETNPNEMSITEMEMLARSMHEDGMMDVLQVVPLVDGKFRIIGGEHRWLNAREMGWEEIPAAVLSGKKWQDEDMQKAAVVRLNTLHGKLSPKKFFDIYTDMIKRHQEDVLQKMLGFSRKGSMLSLIKVYGRRLKAAGVSKERLAEFDAAAQKAKTIDQLNAILQKIMTSGAGETLNKSFLIFNLGGKDHLFVNVKPELWTNLQALMAAVNQNGLNASDVFSQALLDWNKLPCFTEK